ncbi:MAG: NADH-quinone oxidoreductase subunit J [Firmicutes bacterium]|nr:NADH-quinone oxidoreductase subunit J [Bacillota bacterium]
MTAQYLSFGALALVTLWSAYKVVTARLITHAALWMALSFTSVSGIFLMLQQEFIAALQVLIYAGAITTMIIFAIMLSSIREIRVEPQEKRSIGQRIRASGLLAVVVGLVFAAFMTYVYYVSEIPKEAVPDAGLLTVRQVGATLFTRFTVPFEVASILLLLAMIGAIILTAKETE